MHVAPLFIAETSPNNLRGKLVSYKEAAIVAGIVLGYAGGKKIYENYANYLYKPLIFSNLHVYIYFD